MSERKVTSFAIAINVADLDRSADFYTRLIGMTELTRHDAPGMRESILQTEGSGGPNLLLVRADGPAEPPEIGTGLSRLAAFVPDLQSVCARLRADDFEVSDPMHVDGDVTVAFVRDPDGFPIELIEANVSS